MGCILSTHKLNEVTIRKVHEIIKQSKEEFPDYRCGQERNAWKGSEVLRHCDRPESHPHPAHLWHHIADFCSAQTFPSPVVAALHAEQTWAADVSSFTTS